MSDFKEWKEKKHARQFLIFPENIGPYLSLDETALSQGELYTIITNKKAKGKKGALVAIIAGTKAEPIVKQLLKIPSSLRNRVKEITLDMAISMKHIASKCFPKAIQVTDRFHVQKLAIEALQNLRIKHRWEALELENQQLQTAKQKGVTYMPEILSNGDSHKQLLARSRYLLYKATSKWTDKQSQRAKILFKEYPDIYQAYSLVNNLRTIFNQTTDKGIALTKLAHWYKEVEEVGFRSFNTVANSIKLNYNTILNYFHNRSTNASAESFNAKIKAFRSQFRGVKNIEFFLFRLTRIFA